MHIFNMYSLKKQKRFEAKWSAFNELLIKGGYSEDNFTTANIFLRKSSFFKAFIIIFFIKDGRVILKQLYIIMLITK